MKFLFFRFYFIIVTRNSKSSPTLVDLFSSTSGSDSDSETGPESENRLRKEFWVKQSHERLKLEQERERLTSELVSSILKFKKITPREIVKSSCNF
jgi:hypothetical protein